MLNSLNRNSIGILVIVLLGVLFLIYSHSSFSSSLVVSTSITSPTEVKSSPSSNHRPKLNVSSDDSQLIRFADESPLIRRYLDVVRDTVCGLTLRTQEKSVRGDRSDIQPLNVDQRVKGLDWPLIGITMVGQGRLMNIEWALRFVLANDVPGDFIECGVWRGGGALFARAVLQALSVTDRHVWLADSFEGLPKARTANDDDKWWQQHYLKVPLEEVQLNFRSFDLLDDRVHFCKGFFVDSLPRCNVSRIAVLRMDGDMYESTMDQLFNLYGKLQVGGVIIVDDYTIPECNRAIQDFRRWHQIDEEIRVISHQQSATYWVKRHAVKIQMDRYSPLLPSTTTKRQA